MSTNGSSPRSADDARDLAPLLVVEVGAGRIVAAAVQQRDVAGRRAAQRIHHRVEATCCLPAVVIGIFDDLEPDAADDRRVVGPGRRADQHPRLRVGGVAISSKPSRSAPQPPGVCTPAIRSSSACSPSRIGRSSSAKALVAGAAEIGFGLLRLEQDALGLLHHLEDRRAPLRRRGTRRPRRRSCRPRIGIGTWRSAQQRIALDGRKIGKPLARAVVVAQHGGRLSEVRRRNPPRRPRPSAPTGR
jgi:hypothetical protein